MTPELLPYAPEPLPLGAKAVATEAFAAVQRFGAQVLSLAGILVILGPPGTGKTFAADTFCSSAGVRVVKLHLVDRARGYEVLRELLAGLGEPSEGRGRALVEAARKAIVGVRMVIYVDEAHLLNREALRQLRWLFDQRGMRFAIVMTGVDFSEAFASGPELESRIARRVEFGKLTGPSLVPSLRALHPTLAATDDNVLREIDRRYCGGVWRHWNHLLIAAAGYGATPESGITRDIAAAAVAAITGKG